MYRDVGSLKKFYLVFFMALFAFAHVGITKPVTASERLQLVETLLERNPNATKDDIVPELYTDHYPRDLLFIKDNIKSREKAETILGELKKLDDYVKDKLNKDLSFAAYAYIGSLWALFLSGGTFKRALEELENGQKLNKKWYMDFYGQKAMDDFQAFPLIHVSKTGLVPLSVLNKGLGFYDKHHKPQAALFFGVATNPVVEFDGFKKQGSSTLFLHDTQHAGFAFVYPSKYFDSNIIEFRDYIKAISALRESMEQTTFSQENKQEIEWAFFNVFHEFTVGGKYRDDLSETLERVSSFSLEKELNSYQEDKERAKREIDTARSLRLTTENVDQKTKDDILAYINKNPEKNLDFEEVEKYISAVLHLNEGYKKLKEHASVFDAIERTW